MFGGFYGYMWSIPLQWSPYWQITITQFYSVMKFLNHWSLRGLFIFSEYEYVKEKVTYQRRKLTTFDKVHNFNVKWEVILVLYVFTYRNLNQFWGFYPLNRSTKTRSLFKFMLSSTNSKLFTLNIMWRREQQQVTNLVRNYLSGFDWYKIIQINIYMLHTKTLKAVYRMKGIERGWTNHR